MGIDEFEFRRVMGHFASGVTVVTACHEGTCQGITVSSFASLSLEPPLVLVCIDQRSAMHEVIERVGSFAVNILTEDGEWLSRLFASRDADKFERVRFFTGTTGAPLLHDALASIECRLHQQLPGGDHTIFIGEVLAGTVHAEQAPLLYYRSGYHRLA